MKYPKIVIDKEVNYILKSSPQLIKPIQPLEPKRRKPVKPEEVKKYSNTSFIILSLFVGIFAIFLSGFSPGFGFIGFGAIGISIYNIINYNKFSKEQKVKYDNYLNELKKYNQIMNDVETIYLDELEYYNTVVLPKYEQEFDNYKSLVNKYENVVFIKEFRIDKLKHFLQNSKAPTKLINQKKYIKGATEDFFLAILSNNINENIFTDLVLDYSSVQKRFSYKPDFIIEVKELNLFIDVEIDEPYVGSNGTPIHFKKSNDKFRNDFFVDNKWIVLRFAEIQVVKYPTECCLLINTLIKCLKEGNIIDYKKIKSIVPNIEGWDKDESNRLAFSRFRNTYLSKELTENIAKEREYLEKKFTSNYHTFTIDVSKLK